MREPARLVPAADKAARLLALRPHFRRELEVKLERSGYGRAEVAEALEKLVRLKLLDDLALARAFVETVARRKGWGRMRVAQELARRGAPEEAAQAALALRSPEDDLEGAREAARRFRSKSSGAASGDAGRAEALARHLSRRGFASSAIFKVLKEMAASTSRLSEARDEGSEAASED
ncbi:MAG: RecX family transcriptional regulator [Thermoanaerobaculia bacterium]|jgi:regulatory protein|nr:RecX family transcriptional regulator [Thermoanaerobaculia bacterium]MBP9824225.1 RecX family transcriptional regulator [Thermoanaerobaculia bacterium]